MTKEEAITNLNMISVAFVEPVTKEQRKLIDDTFDMAIKALEQQSCDDAISREAVCNIVNDIRDCISVEGYCAILERMKKLPLVTQKSAKWIPVNERLPEEAFGCCDWFEEDKEYSFRVEIPDNATNGDILNKLFPNFTYGTNGEHYHVWSDDGKCTMNIHQDFWNAQYQKGGKE